jgi:tetratricopeptide (TPR) repeat protein
MKGKLTDQPLAELIHEISEIGFSGTLRANHERIKLAIYFDKGRLVFAASNIRTLRLVEYLRKRNVVSEDELARIEENCSDLRIADQLTSNEVLSPEVANGLLAAVVGDTLRVGLLWTEGAWEFDERARLNETSQVSVDVKTLLREAAHRLPLKFVSHRFRNPGEVFSRVDDVNVAENLLPSESFILSRLDLPVPLSELVAVSGLRDLDAYRVIYGLTLSGSIKREYWQHAFRADGRKLGADKAGVNKPPSVAPADVAQTRWTAKQDEEADLEAFLLRVDRASNYYEVLDMPPTATTDEFKDAYYSLARRYHPDRFHLKSGTDLHARISSVFARITQAYETLTEPNARSAYDVTLERSRQYADAAPKLDTTVATEAPLDEFELKTPAETELGQAEYNFREGFGALQQGRKDAAVSHLAIAARLVPNDARYRAYYGRALAAQEKTRRLAENEIQAAVKLQPANAAYRTMLAELYFELKFHRRAQTEVDRALALDPNNASALALQRKIGKSQKIG